MGDELILVRGASYRYPRAAADALVDASLTVRPGELHAVLGPNGSGKTTLVRVALGIVAPRAGSAAILGRAATAWPPRALARVVGVVTQREDHLFPQRVSDTVALGRYAHLPVWGVARAADRAAVERALTRCDVRHLAARWVWTLSGGEYQRVRLARALAQEPRLLVLDEPTANLDVRHEMELLELLRGLADRDRLGVVLVTHQLNLAARFADRALLLAAGRPAGSGPPGAVLTRDTVARVFGWPVAITAFEGRPQVTPLRQGTEEP
jgi:ABC-type cobalamin/Fe3+-siderophores transport system ATPase subunit